VLCRSTGPSQLSVGERTVSSTLAFSFVAWVSPFWRSATAFRVRPQQPFSASSLSLLICAWLRFLHRKTALQRVHTADDIRGWGACARSELAYRRSARDAEFRTARQFCEVFLNRTAIGLTTGTVSNLQSLRVEIRDATGLSSLHVTRRIIESGKAGLIIFEKGQCRSASYASSTRRPPSGRRGQSHHTATFWAFTQSTGTQNNFMLKLARLDYCRNHSVNETALAAFYSAGEQSLAISVVSWVHAHARSRSANREIKR
jgi:hypothetical protein